MQTLFKYIVGYNIFLLEIETITELNNKIIKNYEITSNLQNQEDIVEKLEL